MFLSKVNYSSIGFIVSNELGYGKLIEERCKDGRVFWINRKFFAEFLESGKSPEDFFRAATVYQQHELN